MQDHVCQVIFQVNTGTEESASKLQAVIKGEQKNEAT